MKQMLILVLCLSADPVIEPSSRSNSNDTPLSQYIPPQNEFETLCRTDPVAAVEASLARFKRDVQSYRCILQKQETLGGRLGKVEVIQLTVQEDPFAACLVWKQGAGSADATLYKAGDGQMLARTALGVIPLDPNMGKGSSRYSIEDAGIKRGSLRTYRAWKVKKDAGELTVEFKGKQKLAELGNRECYVIHRTIQGLEVDNFRLLDNAVRDPAKHPKEAFAAVTIYLDCETWMQVGSQLWKPDGSLYANYFFRDIELNPKLAADQFTKKAIEK